MLKSAARMDAQPPLEIPLSPQGWQLADLHVDQRTRRVLRSGVDLEVTSLSFELLLSLIRAAPGLVTFDSLMEQVWPGLVVSPETLTQRVRLLRQSLGDSAESPRYILAVRGHGYRLLAPVSPLAAPAFPPPPGDRARPWRAMILAFLLAIAGIAAAQWLRAPDPGDTRVSGSEEAYRYLLQAQSIVNGTPPSFRAAIALYTDALDLDPHLGRAYSGRAMNRVSLVWVGSGLARGLEDAEADARMALQIDGMDPVAHSAMASIHALRGNWQATQKSFLAAISANTADADVRGRYAVTLLLSTGQLRAAMAQATEAQKMSPDDGFAAATLAFVAHASGADRDAVRMADLAASRGADRAQLAHIYSSAAARSGRFAEAADHAIGVLPPAVLDVGGASAIRQAFMALKDSSHRPAALEALRKLTSQPAWEHAEPRSRQAVVYLLATLGAMDELHFEMNRMLRQGSDTYPQIIAIGMMWAPEMRAFRQGKPFQEITHRLGLMDYWQAVGPPDECTIEESQITCR